jgi:GNAT superfamily N-acetyltransferase
MSAPFLILGLPRSRTYWLSRFLSYGGWHCGHDQARHIRSIEDVRSLLSINNTGSAETSAAYFWRLLRHERPDLKIAVIRRDPGEVTESLMRFGCYNRARLTPALARLDRHLDRCARTPGVLSVDYAALQTEAGCQRVFEHCLERPFDRAWWANMAQRNLQIDLPAQVAYALAHERQLATAAHACAQAQRYLCLRRQASPPPDADGIVIQEEGFADWWRDGQALIAQHCAAIGLGADAAARMDVPLWDRLCRAGVAQIMTARLNGRMLAYLTAFIQPSVETPALVATQLAFFVSPNAKGMHLGLRMQRACIARARARGAVRMYLRAGVRGDGPRLGGLYRRLGARDYGQLYELDLAP